MKCPFCGEEMELGALRSRGRYESDFAFVPPAADPPEDDKLHILWTQKKWDDKKAVSLTRTLKERKALMDMFLTGDDYFAQAWRCAKCEKALAVFEAFGPYIQEPASTPDTPDGPRSTEGELLSQTWDRPPDQEPAKPKSKPRRKSRKDPWDKGGPLGRRGDKPDWEL